MNFFPNLQINFHIYETETSSSRTSRMSTTHHSSPITMPISPPQTNDTTMNASRTPSRQTTTASSHVLGDSLTSSSTTSLGQIISRLLRNSQSSSTGSGDDISDIHFYVNVDRNGETTLTEEGLTIEQMYDVSVLEQALHSESSCSICQHNIESGTIQQKITACSHTFHPSCIQQWLVSNNSCPVCRTSL